MERDGDDMYLEHFPLVGNRPSKQSPEDAAGVREPRRWDFFVLTVPFFGLQLAWTIQQVYGIPYLSSLGVSNTQMPLFVLSGPLAGLIGPPIVAALSEKCDGQWGRRKPLILSGGVGTIVSFLILSAAESLAHQPSAMLWVSRFSALGSVFVALVGFWYSPAFWDLSVVVTSIMGVLLCIVAFTNTATTCVMVRLVLGPTLYQRVHIFRLFVLQIHGSRVGGNISTDCLSDDGNDGSYTDTEATSKDLSESTSAMSRVALLFHTAALVTIVVVSIIWQRSGNRSRFGRGQPHAETHEDNMLQSRDIKLAHTRTILMDLIWKPSLACLAASLAGVCLLVSAAIRPFSSTITTAISLLLGGNGIMFALSNWVPYALIACEASAQARSRLLAMAASDASINEDDMRTLPADGESGGPDDSDFHDDVPLVLAVHNMAVTVPQIVASVASWILMQLLALFGLEQDVVWIFALCIPPALWAACL
ncbi:sucrose transporter [Diaporthe helianthi]|uniref:Sucrose transporter n=1 Tax=Diaporthe helianthi TaxID=158607 RepID=A0A2P5I2Q6_DIAHE|nr:sucrose transporter [Diaporthe helianthi]